MLLLIKILRTDLEFTDQNENASLGGFEPPTFRLTAERAKRLRRRQCLNFSFSILFSPLSDEKIQYKNYF